MRFAVVGFLLFLITGCAGTYKQPTAVTPMTSSAITASKARVMSESKRILISEGFQIVSSDDAAGVISTAPRNLRVTPEQANCGTTMGLDYLKDKRTSTRVGFGVIVEEGRLTIRSTIEGEYKPGAATQDITLTCVSRGLLEKDLLTKIISKSDGQS